MEFDAELPKPAPEPPDHVVEGGAAAVEGEGTAPAPLSDVPIPEELLELGDEEPPEPLLPAVNKHVGPETQSQRDARYREMRENEERLLQALREEFPNSVLAQAGAKELERDQRMEPIRAAFIKTKGEKK